jgi:hypothetical protein
MSAIDAWRPPTIKLASFAGDSRALGGHAVHNSLALLMSVVCPSEDTRDESLAAL